MSDFVIAACILVMPTVLHLRLLFGQVLPEPVAPRKGTFSRFFNRWPLALSLAAGVFGAAGYLLRAHPPLPYAFYAMAVLALAGDLVGSGISYYRYVSQRPRARRKAR